eukprot:m.702765 g.702765  ORF g.702765 m.702765 type:complete len:98 (+) comp58712_c0_seq76:1900-2193(+)
MSFPTHSSFIVTLRQLGALVNLLDLVDQPALAQGDPEMNTDDPPDPLSEVLSSTTTTEPGLTIAGRSGVDVALAPTLHVDLSDLKAELAREDGAAHP